MNRGGEPDYPLAPQVPAETQISPMAQVFDPQTHRPEALHVPSVPHDGLFLHLQAPLTHSKAEVDDVGHSHPFASLLSQSLQFVLHV